MQKNFSVLFRRLRIEAGLSQAALAELAGLSVKAVAAYEQGLRATPRRETVAELVRVFGLTGEARADFERLSSRRPSASALNEPAGNLPWQPTSFVGRQRELGELSSLLAPRSLVTITGTGGIGKTRMALEVAARRAPLPADGRWFVDLSSIAEGVAVPNKIAAVLELQLPADGDPIDAVAIALKSRSMLLILDNCEHVIVTVRAVAEAIMRESPHVALLATSRERLGVAGEVVYQLPPLPTPAKAATMAQARSCDALTLFVQRASMAKHGFELADCDVELAAEICRRLDGIALAIELAAARVPVLGLAELRAQLAKQFRVVAGGPSLPARQQTLYATLSWSHDLLDELDRMLFRRLGIFVGGWTLEAAEMVCAGDALDVAAVFDALCSLVEKSLVVVDLDTASPRYSFFESTREFAMERLAASSDGTWLAQSHARWMAVVAEDAYDSFATTPRRKWEHALLNETGNALAALEWSLTHGDYVLTARIAGGLRGLWGDAELRQHGLRFVNAPLARLDPHEHPELVARLLLAQVQFLDPVAMADAMNRAISVLDGSGQARTGAMCYGYLAHALNQAGSYAQAEGAYEKADRLLRGDGLERSTLYSGLLTEHGTMLFREGRIHEARGALSEALSLSASLEDDWSILVSQSILAEIEFADGNVRSAIRLTQDALAGARWARGSLREISSLCNLACFRLSLGELEEAGAAARMALDLARTSNAVVVHVAGQHLAAVAALQGEAAKGARFLGYVDAWCDRVSYLRDATEQKSYDILMVSLRAQLSEDEIAALAAKGAALTEGAAIAELLSV